MPDSASRAKLRAAFELSPTIMAVTDLATGRVVDVNDAFLRTTGFGRDEVLGRTIPELGLWVNPDQRAEGLARLRAGGSVRDLEARFRTKTGDEIVAIANADVVDLDGRPCVLTALMDITARVRAEAALRESEQRFAHFFHANPLSMVIVRRRDDRYLDVNDAAVRRGGYTREEMIGRTRAELGIWAHEAERAAMQARLDRDGRVRDLEVGFRMKTGEERRMLLNAETISYGGEPAVLTVSVDITERAQVARAKDEFLAMLGHELRNPLGTITTALTVLERRIPDPDLRHLTALIGRQTAHLTRLVDDLLDVARVTSGKIEMRPAVVDLHALAMRCVESLTAAGRTREHDVVVEGDRVHVHGDPTRLEQVLGNLVDNALKYTPGGGSVRVGTRRDGRDAVLTVRDTGEGIHPDLLDRVFDLFVQQSQALDRARGGLGLGLTLVKRLVELHGGTVAVSSAGPGHGSTFTVRLPATSAAECEPAGDAFATPATPRAKRRVLLVEDNPDARESLEILLTLAGHEVATSADAPTALETFVAFRPDVVLVDIGLPGMDGYELGRAIRDKRGVEGLLLVALTGYGQAEDQAKARAAGFDLHLTKPVDPDRLTELLG
jgi:PAS domain S-box-containing protein